MPAPTYTGNDASAVAAITEDDKVDIRRYCGYPAYGVSNMAFFELGFWLNNFTQLESRMVSMSVSEVVRVQFFLNNLRRLETDLFEMREAMIVDSAAVFHRNENEAADRHSEFIWWSKHLLNFLGIKGGPNFEGNSGCNVRMLK